MKIFTITISFFIILPQVILSQSGKYNRKEEDRIKMFFNYCDQNKYQRYSGITGITETEDYFFYEVDSIRIYLSYHFFLGFSTYNDTIAKENFRELKNDYGQLFEQGFLTGNMFFCELSDSCEYYTETGLMIQKGDSLISYYPDLFGYRGPIIKILKIKHKKYYDTRIRRRFEIWCTPSKLEDGWGAFPVFFLELTNYEARRKASLTDFLNGAKISCFRYGYTQI